jgi:hypothetical protein
MACSTVMPGLVPGIHVLKIGCSRPWMAGTSPGHDDKGGSDRDDESMTNRENYVPDSLPSGENR